eukprot:5157989-Prymnesium_polylepis.1
MADGGARGRCRALRGLAVPLARVDGLSALQASVKIDNPEASVVESIRRGVRAPTCVCMHGRSPSVAYPAR